jgi:hypothetical protein
LVVSVYTQHGTGGEEQSAAPENRPSSATTVRPLEHYSCGVVSLLFAGVLVSVFYPLLVSLTTPLGMFATTALVSVAVLVWGFGWIGAELLWEWRAGRLLPR